MTTAAHPTPARHATLPLWRAACVAAAMAGATALAIALKPAPPHDEAPAASLADGVPSTFGSWRMLPMQPQLAPVTDGTETSMDQPYDQTLMRAYADDQGRVVMLALAWGRHQRQDVKIHRPEVCYPAQGYVQQGRSVDQPLSLPGVAQPVAARGMVARIGNDAEVVRYWIRVGQQYGGDGLATRWYLFKEGLQGRVHDGVLVRASLRMPGRDATQPDYAVLDRFLRDLSGAVHGPVRSMLIQ